MTLAQIKAVLTADGRKVRKEIIHDATDDYVVWDETLSSYEGGEELHFEMKTLRVFCCSGREGDRAAEDIRRLFYDHGAWVGDIARSYDHETERRCAVFDVTIIWEDDDG